MHGTDKVPVDATATAIEEATVTSIQLVNQFWQASDQALVKQRVIAKVLARSEAWLERSRLDGDGPPFIKMGRAVVYRKADVLAWLSRFECVNSTSEYRDSAR